MNANRSSKKTRAILKAIAEGNSFEQILGRYSTLNYHDIFRAAAQAPTRNAQHKLMSVTATAGLHDAWAGKDTRLAPRVVLHTWSD